MLSSHVVRSVIVSFLLQYFVECQQEVLLEESSAIESLHAPTGGGAELPCDVTPALPDDRMGLVIWYKQGHDSPIYSQPGQFPGGGWGAPQQGGYGGGGQQQGGFGGAGQQNTYQGQPPAYQGQPPPFQGQPGPNEWAPDLDEEDDPKTRNHFILKVFLLTFFVLLVVAAVAVLTQINGDVTKPFFKSALATTLFFVAIGIAIMVLIGIMCCPFCDASPGSWIALFFMTVAESYIVAYITIRFETPMLMISMSITAAIVLVCVALACTSFDFTKFYVYFVLASLAMMFVGMAFSILWFVFGIYYKPVHIAITVVALLIQVVGLVMELQMILGGKSIQFDVDDIAIPALLLSTSIISIFLDILTLLDLTKCKT